MQVQLQPKPLPLHLVFLPQKPKLFFPNSSKRTATSLRVSAAATTAATTGNMYELLSVRESAGLEEIKAAFRRLARKLHPDTCRSSEEEKERLTQQFIRAREAYRVLSDPDLRQDYDFRLKNGFASLNKRSTTTTRRQGFGDWESQLEALKRRSSVRHPSSTSSSSSWGCRMRARAAAAGN